MIREVAIFHDKNRPRNPHREAAIITTPQRKNKSLNVNLKTGLIIFYNLSSHYSHNKNIKYFSGSHALGLILDKTYIYRIT